MRERADVLVIGAGPAGLSVAARLEQAGTSVLVLERGPCAGDSWRRMPTHMPLNSPWGASAIDGSRVPWRRWSRLPSRAEYHAHLMDFSRAAGLRIRTDCVVTKVAATDAGFQVMTSRGDFEARRLVNATGYFCQPAVPQVPGASRSRICQLTIPDYRDAESLRARLAEGRRRVLIVGARITAGQLAQELTDAGFDVTISHRSPLRFGWAPLLQRAGYRLYYPWERLRLRKPAFAKRDSALPMAGGRIRWLLWRGRVATRPRLAALNGEYAVFADGQRERFDALLWATGYRPALGHLASLVKLDPDSGLPKLREHESAEVPGLFFLGLDQQTDFTSRMLRGIRRDAAVLSARLQRGSGT